MEPIESSETSAYNNTLAPGTYPKEKKLQSKHGESLKSIIPSNLFLLRLSRPQRQREAGRIKSMKTSMTPSGIEHATFRLLVQFLSQLRHCVPRSDTKAYIISRGTGILQVEYETSWNEDLEIYVAGTWRGTHRAQWYTESVTCTLLSLLRMKIYT